MAQSPIRAERKKLGVMRISSKIFAALVCVGVLGPVATVSGIGPALAFDPEKVFEEKKPAPGKIIRFFLNAWKKGDNEDAIGALKYAADQGDHGAQWKLGQMYANGQGVQKSDAEAFYLYKQIADSYPNAQPGTADWTFTANAMVALGKYYLTGIPDAGIAADPYEARVMFTTAATYFGHSEAQFQLARLHLASADIEENVIANVSAGDRASGSIGNIESRMDQGGHRHGHRAEIRFPQAIYELIIKLILPYEVGIRDVSYRSIRILNGRSIGRISDSSQGEGRPLSNGIIL